MPYFFLEPVIGISLETHHRCFETRNLWAVLRTKMSSGEVWQIGLFRHLIIHLLGRPKLLTGLLTIFVSHLEFSEGAKENA